MKCSVFQEFQEGKLNQEAFRRHARHCETCRMAMEGERRLEKGLERLREPVHSPWLWSRIEANLKQAKRKKRRNRLGVAAGIPAAVLAAVLLILMRPASFKEPVLNGSTLRRVEKLETAYEKAIGELEESAIPKLAQMDIELMLLYREKLETIDLQIQECREALMENPANTHIRRYMLAALQDKKRALREILQAPSSQDRKMDI